MKAGEHRLEIHHASLGTWGAKRIAAVVLAWACLCASGGAMQAAAPDVDLVKLLTETELAPSTLSDGVWTLTPPRGRRLLLVPFAVPQRLAQPVSLSDVSTKLSGGQLVAWHIPVSDADGSPRSQPLAGQFKADPPRLTREAELRPDGTIRWKLTRSLPGGSVDDVHQLYALAIGRSLLDPPRPRSTPGQRPAPVTPEEQRQRLAQRTAVINALKSLPDEFTAPAPATIYAVYSIPETLTRLAFAGPDPLPWSIPFTTFDQLREAARGTGDPKEWRPLLEQLTRDDHAFGMRIAAAFLAANSNISKLGENSLLVPLVEKLVTKGGPVTRRMLVEAVAASDNPTPVAGAMLDAVMADPDGSVAVAAMRARVNDAARRQQPLNDAQLKSFAESASRLLADPAGPPALAVLAPAMELARQNEAHLVGLSDRMRVHQVPESRRAEMIAAVLSGARQRDPLAARWLDKELLSPADPKLAAATLQQVISTPLRTIVEPDPQLASEPSADGPSEAERPARSGPPRGGRAIVSAIFEGIPGASQPSEQSLPPAVGPTGVEVAPRSTPIPAVRLPGSLLGGLSSSHAEAPQQSLQPALRTVPDQPYPLDSPEHNLLQLLANKDTSLRELAWRALPRFTIATADSPTSLSQQKLTETYVALADAAGALDPTPVEVVPFLQAQADRAAVELGMQRLLAKAHGPARVTAMLHVAAAGATPLAEALTAMSADERVAVAGLWYSAASSADEESGGGEPLVLGLLRHDEPASAGSPVVQWFAQQVAEGRRPPAGDWAQAVGSDETLIAGLTSPDERYALACAAAIIGTVMPPDEPMAAALRGAAMEIASSASDNEELQREVQLRWSELRQTMIRERLRSAAGLYSVTLRILPTPQTPRNDPAKLRPVKHDLGRVEMTVDAEGNVTFTPTLSVTVADRPLSLKLNDPQELLALPSAQELMLRERGDAPGVALDLMLDRAGRWTAWTILPDQRNIRLILTPVK